MCHLYSPLEPFPRSWWQLSRFLHCVRQSQRGKLKEDLLVESDSLVQEGLCRKMESNGAKENMERGHVKWTLSTPRCGTHRLQYSLSSVLISEGQTKCVPRLLRLFIREGRGGGVRWWVGRKIIFPGWNFVTTPRNCMW